MAQEKSLSDESRQRGLINRGRVLIHRAPDLDQRIDQLLWCNDVAQTQRGVKNLTHRSGVNHVAGVIESLQGRARRPSKAELGVKVVFENKCVVNTRKIEQGGPSLKTHRHSKGKLM